MSIRKEHWENVYQNKSPDEVSWYQRFPVLSLQLVANAHLAFDAPIIDVGGGASTLVDELCGLGYRNVSVLDVSASAIAHAKHRGAEKVSKVHWYEEDVICFRPPRRFALWHDRAVFHFLTNRADRESYISVLKQSIEPDGHIIMMTFAIDGPKKCSGLDIIQYDADKLLSELGPGFELEETGFDNHITPLGNQQRFAYFRFIAMPESG